MALFDYVLDDDPEDDNPLPASIRKLSGFELLAERQKVRPLICRICGEPIARVRQQSPRGFICDPCAKKQKNRERAEARNRAARRRRQAKV